MGFQIQFLNMFNTRRIKLGNFVFLTILSVGLIFGIAYAYQYTITVLAPTDGEVWIRDTMVRIDWVTESDNPSFNSYTFDVFLDKYPEATGGNCVTNSPCYKLGDSYETSTRTSELPKAGAPPIQWLVGRDNNGREIPDGQYTVRIYSSSATGPGGQRDPNDSGPVQGISGVITIVTGNESSPTPPLPTESVPIESTPPSQSTQKNSGLETGFLVFIIIGGVIIFSTISYLLRGLLRPRIAINLGTPPISQTPPNQDLLNYISQSRRQGISDDQIRKNLLSSGWPEEEIKKIL